MHAGQYMNKYVNSKQLTITTHEISGHLWDSISKFIYFLIQILFPLFGADLLFHFFFFMIPPLSSGSCTCLIALIVTCLTVYFKALSTFCYHTLNN